MQINAELVDIPMQLYQIKATDIPAYNFKHCFVVYFPMCRQKKKRIFQSHFSHFFECYIFVLFPYSTNQVFLFLLQSNNISFK